MEEWTRDGQKCKPKGAIFRESNGRNALLSSRLEDFVINLPFCVEFGSWKIKTVELIIIQKGVDVVDRGGSVIWEKKSIDLSCCVFKRRALRLTDAFELRKDGQKPLLLIAKKQSIAPHFRIGVVGNGQLVSVCKMGAALNCPYCDRTTKKDRHGDG